MSIILKSARTSKASVAKLVDARDLKSRDFNGRAGSIPARGTILGRLVTQGLQAFFM